MGYTDTTLFYYGSGSLPAHIEKRELDFKLWQAVNQDYADLPEPVRSRAIESLTNVAVRGFITDKKASSYIPMGWRHTKVAQKFFDNDERTPIISSFSAWHPQTLLRVMIKSAHSVLNSGSTSYYSAVKKEDALDAGKWLVENDHLTLHFLKMNGIVFLIKNEVINPVVKQKGYRSLIVFKDTVELPKDVSREKHGDAIIARMRTDDMAVDYYMRYSEFLYR